MHPLRSRDVRVNLCRHNVHQLPRRPLPDSSGPDDLRHLPPGNVFKHHRQKDAVRGLLAGKRASKPWADVLRGLPARNVPEHVPAEPVRGLLNWPVRFVARVFRVRSVPAWPRKPLHWLITVHRLSCWHVSAIFGVRDVLAVLGRDVLACRGGRVFRLLSWILPECARVGTMLPLPVGDVSGRHRCLTMQGLPPGIRRRSDRQ